MMTRGMVRGLAVVLAIAPLGCSFVNSSESSWRSSRSSSNSSTSSDSSSGGDEKKEAAYRDDVRDYTYAAVAASAPDPRALARGIGDLARHHGISNWEEDGDTWRGIGAGLAKAEATPATVDAFARDLARSDPGRAAEMRRAYTAAQAS